MLLLHCRWQKRIGRKDGSEQFYDRPEARGQKPKSRDMVENNFDWLGMSVDTAARHDLHSTFNYCSSYVHAPIGKEPFAILIQGNVGQIGAGVLQHRLDLARDTVRIALENLIHLYPQGIFPVDTIRKFGLNQPAGMYFGKFYYAPLEAVFGDAQIESYRARLQIHPSLEDAMNFHES